MKQFRKYEKAVMRERNAMLKFYRSQYRLSIKEQMYGSGLLNGLSDAIRIIRKAGGHETKLWSSR